jgi:hypothetical protein
MPAEIDPLKAYTEACNTIRHYSNASLSVRLASVVLVSGRFFPHGTPDAIGERVVATW